MTALSLPKTNLSSNGDPRAHALVPTAKPRGVRGSHLDTLNHSRVTPTLLETSGCVREGTEHLAHQWLSHPPTKLRTKPKSRALHATSEKQNTDLTIPFILSFGYIEFA